MLMSLFSSLFVFQFLSDTFGITYLSNILEDWKEKERGCFPTPIECMIIFWVIALMWKDVKEVYDIGLTEYLKDLWNLADIFTNICFTGWIVLRITAYIIVKKEEASGLNPYIKREDWHAYGGNQVKFWAPIIYLFDGRFLLRIKQSFFILQLP